MLLCLLCWGSWAALFKAAKKYRFELFYFDFGFGLALVALVCALTFGSLGYDGFKFTDDLLNARKQEWLYGFLAAMIFNFGNMLLLAAVSVAGLSTAFPLAFGVAMVVGGWMNYMNHPDGSSMILVCGTILILVSIVLGSSGYSHLRVLQHEAQARAGKTKSTRRPTSIKGTVLACVSGLVMGLFSPLLVRAQDPDVGVGPYALLFIFAGAVVISTFVFNLFFMNLPVEGDPLEIADFIKPPVTNHLFGLAGGVVWGIGAIAYFVVGTPKSAEHMNEPLFSILAQGAPLVAGLLGLLLFKELKEGDLRVKAFRVVTLLLFGVGLIAFSYAPVWGAR